MSPLLRNMFLSAGLLGFFAVVGTGLVAWTHHVTAEQIAENERAALLHTVHDLVPPRMHDNDLYEDRIEITAPGYLGTAAPLPVYRARKDGKPVAAILTTVAPNGYGGAIKLLVAVRYDGTVAGVRVLNHHETPGLGDAIETSRSSWVYSFNGKSIGHPPLKQWAVKKDNGVFDQFTGATITPRAVVGAVRNTLLYFNAHRDELFQRKPKEA